MQKKKKLALALVLSFMLTSLFLVACTGSNTQAAGGEPTPISVNNDTVTFSEQGTVTDPHAGEIIGTVTSEDIEFDSLGIAASPDVYVAPGNLEGLTLGIPPQVPHGDDNGEGCITCHETGAGGAPKLVGSHTDAGIDNSYCRNCHQNA